MRGQLVGVSGHFLLQQQIGGSDDFFTFGAIADEGDFRARPGVDLIKQVARAAKSRQGFFLIAAGVADGAGTGHILDKVRQPVFQLRIVGGGEYGDADLAEESRVVDTLVGLAVARDKARTVNAKQHVQVHQADIVDNLVVGTLEKGGVDGHRGQQPLAGQARCKADGVLLGHADIIEPLFVAVLEEVEAGAVLHSRRDGAEFRHIVADLGQCGAEHRREGILGRQLRVGQVA